MLKTTSSNIKKQTMNLNDGYTILWNLKKRLVTSNPLFNLLKMDTNIIKSEPVKLSNYFKKIKISKNIRLLENN